MKKAGEMTICEHGTPRHQRWNAECLNAVQRVPTAAWVAEPWRGAMCGECESAATAEADRLWYQAAAEAEERYRSGH